MRNPFVLFVCLFVFLLDHLECDACSSGHLIAVLGDLANTLGRAEKNRERRKSPSP